MEFQQGFDRYQLQMMDYNSMVASDSWARIVDLFVEILPLEALGFQDVLHNEGRPPFHSSDLLKLYLYGYKNHLRSSRKLAHACKVNIEVIWLLKGLCPSARTLAYFRKNNSKAFKKSFQFFVSLLKEWELVTGEVIAIDSFKIRAQNALKNNFNQKKINRHKEYIDTKIEEYEKAIETADTYDEKEELRQKIAYQNTKRDKYERIERQLEESGESQISLTDPDAKSVVLHRNIVNVGYNIQAGCEGKHKLFVNNDTGSVNDTNALSTMALAAKELLGVDKMDCLTDKGYTTGKHLQICEENGITTYSSPKEHSSQKNGLYDMKIFHYQKDTDSYICPNNKVLSTNGRTYNTGNLKVKHYKNFKACTGCPLRSQCTTAQNGRLIERSIYQEAIEANEKRVNENPDYYRERQQITEHQFGTLKRQWGFTYTLMKGKENVLSEVNLMMICYNLRRLMSIYGINELKNKLSGLVLDFFGNISLFLTFLRPFCLKTSLT